MEVNKTAGLARNLMRGVEAVGAQSRTRLLNNLWPCRGTDSPGRVRQLHLEHKRVWLGVWSLEPTVMETGVSTCLHMEMAVPKGPQKFLGLEAPVHRKGRI